MSDEEIIEDAVFKHTRFSTLGKVFEVDVSPSYPKVRQLPLSMLVRVEVSICMNLRSQCSAWSFVRGGVDWYPQCHDSGQQGHGALLPGTHHPEEHTILAHVQTLQTLHRITHLVSSKSNSNHLWRYVAAVMACLAT